VLVDVRCKEAAEQSGNGNDRRHREVIHKAPSVAMGVHESDPCPHQDPKVRPEKADRDRNRDDYEQNQVTHQGPPMRHRCWPGWGLLER